MTYNEVYNIVYENDMRFRQGHGIDSDDNFVVVAAGHQFQAYHVTVLDLVAFDDKFEISTLSRRLLLENDYGETWFAAKSSLVDALIESGLCY